MISQKEMCYLAMSSTTRRYKAFVDLITDLINPLTSSDINKLCDRFPEKYGNFRFLAKMIDDGIVPKI